MILCDLLSETDSSTFLNDPIDDRLGMIGRVSIRDFPTLNSLGLKSILSLGLLFEGGMYFNDIDFFMRMIQI